MSKLLPEQYTRKILIVAECNVNLHLQPLWELSLKILIVAECNVNFHTYEKQLEKLKILIVAECNVNASKSIGENGSSSF